MYSSPDKVKLRSASLDPDQTVSYIKSKKNDDANPYSIESNIQSNKFPVKD